VISRAEIEKQILEQARASSDVKKELAKSALAVRDYWRSVSPVGLGAYAASVKVFNKSSNVKGMPAARVGATDFKAHWIEFGTGKPGPTEAFAPRAKTAAHFGGDESVVSVDSAGADE
jgi:hypothetical protein